MSLLAPSAFAPRGRLKALDLVTRAGLAANLALCVDIGDSASYAGTGQTVTDRSPTGSTFDLGATSGAEASDPTFNGVAGRVSEGEYLSFDAGDWLTLSGANPAWIETIHKDSPQFTLMVLVLIGVVGTAQNLMGTVGASANNVGFAFVVSSGGAPQLVVGHGSGVALNQSGSGSLLLTAENWNVVAVSVDEPAGSVTWMRNGRFEVDSATYTTPSASAANSPLQIGARGAGTGPLSSGSRLAVALGWSRALTQGEMRLAHYWLKARVPTL